jgi:hypothetical protein
VSSESHTEKENIKKKRNSKKNPVLLGFDKTKTRRLSDPAAGGLKVHEKNAKKESSTGVSFNK